MGEQNPNIEIPAVMVGYAAGQRIRQSIYKDLASLSYDAERKIILSSHLSLPEQCNRVRSPPFALSDNSAISIWVNFGIEGMVDDSIYDRANVGLFSKGKRVTIAPDDGHRYNSYGVVNTNNVEACPAPGIIGWRKGTGSAVKKVTFSPDALKDTNLIYEIVELDIALASGAETHGSYFTIHKVELTNVGLLMPDAGSGICATPPASPLPSFSSPPTSEDLDLGLNSTFTTPSLADGSAPPPAPLPSFSSQPTSESLDLGLNSTFTKPFLADGSVAQEQGSIYPGKEDLADDNSIRDEGRDGGIGGGLILTIIFLFTILAAAVAYLTRTRWTFPDHNLCSLTNFLDLENPMHTLDTAEVSINVAVIPVSVLEEEEQNESKVEGTQSDTATKRTLSALTESLSSLFASSSEEEKGDDDESQYLQSDEDVIDDDAASKMISFINIFL